MTWSGGLSFTARTGSGHDLIMDLPESMGGMDRGPRPTELLLAALGSCSGVDVVSILQKMRVPFDRLQMAVEADAEKEQPGAFTAFRIVYRLWGENVPPEKFHRAVELSQNTYCSVAGLLCKGASISYRLELNGNRIELT